MISPRKLGKNNREGLGYCTHSSFLIGLITGLSHKMPHWAPLVAMPKFDDKVDEVN